MSSVLSNADAILVAIPMIGLLFVGVFRLDEIFIKPKKKQTFHCHPLATVDDRGQPVRLDPDGAPRLSNGPAGIRRHRVTR